MKHHETLGSNNQLCCTGDSGQLVWISPILSVQQACQPLAITLGRLLSIGFYSLVLPSPASNCLLRLTTMEVGLVAAKHRKAGIADGRVVVPLLCSGCTSATTGYLVTWLDLAGLGW